MPCEEALSFEKSPYMVDVDDYKTELAASLADAWRITYDKKARVKEIRADCVMVYMPQEANGVSKKLAWPHFGPYWVLDVHPDGLTVRPVSRPKDPSIRVNLEQATLCPPELLDESWLGNKRHHRKSPKELGMSEWDTHDCIVSLIMCIVSFLLYIEPRVVPISGRGKCNQLINYSLLLLLSLILVGVSSLSSHFCIVCVWIFCPFSLL